MLPPSVQRVSNLLGQRAEPLLRSSSWAGGSKENAAEQVPCISEALIVREGARWAAGWALAPPRPQPRIPTWKPSLVGLATDFTLREESA